MNRKSITFIGCILFGLLMVGTSNLWAEEVQSTPAVLDMGGTLVRASIPIEINGDTDFGPFSGNGSALNPYIIEGLSFSDTPLRCIEIYHTTKHFILQHCVFFNVSEAIELYNVTHGRLFENDIRNSTSGISIRFSSNIEVENNTVLFGFLGLKLLYSENSSIIGNNLSYNSEKGLSLFNANKNFIMWNNLTHNEIGIDLSASNNNTLCGNTFQCNLWYDWKEFSCSGNYFEGNILKSCGPESSLDVYFIIIGVVAGGAVTIIGVRTLYHRRTSDIGSPKKRKKTKGYL
jgi:parallel beta-helix repeat protein